MNPTQDDINRRRVIFIVVALTIIAISLLAIFLIRKPGSIEGVVVYEQPARGHNDALQYEQTGLPPVGGPHHSEWQVCGVYEQPVEPGRAVHSLEHGAVWITYDPALPPDQIAELEALVGERDFLLLSPFPDQSRPIVLTAWGVQLGVENSRDQRINAFISRYRLGPTTPERGATC